MNGLCVLLKWGMGLSVGVGMVMLLGCATTVKEEGQATFTPFAVVQNADEYLGKSVYWGGQVVRTINLPLSSEVEIVAYKLSRQGKPDVTSPPLGRFIAVSDGYLESVDYASGRLVSVRGQVEAVRQGKIGQSSYLFPLISVSELKLWDKDNVQTKPRISFGFSMGSGGHSGVGVGVGF